LEEAADYYHDFAFQTVANSFFSVDSFFFLSGLLVVYLSLQQMELTAGRFAWIKYYMHRFWRLTPTYAIALLIYWKLMPHFGNGPLWGDLYNIDSKHCDNYWWTNLLYINNFHPEFNKMCMLWTWFLAADTQMYVLSPLVIIPAYFFGFYGLVSLATMLLAVLIAIAVIVSVNEFPANVIIKGGSSATTYTNIVYIRFYTRAAPYLIGMAVGYFLIRGGKLKAKLPKSKVVSFVGWLLASALGVTVVYGLYDYNHGHKYSQAASSLYLTFSSALWGICLAWVVYACVSGRGGFVDVILSWSGWFPLSRLTYSAYLLHPVIVIVYIGSLRQPVFINNLHMAYFFVGVLGISYAAAAVLSLCVEYPMAAMEKIILQRKSF
jgi:peptidoglycan/LPS O-acetylase OafA/YrhL